MAHYAYRHTHAQTSFFYPSPAPCRLSFSTSHSHTLNFLRVISFARFSFPVSIRVMKFAMQPALGDNKATAATVTQQQQHHHHTTTTIRTYLVDGAKRHDEAGNE